MPDEKLVSSKIHMNGELTIDVLNGTAEFKDGWGRTVLRVTHLPNPLPADHMIDLVAIRNVTSYTPLQPQAENVILDSPPDTDLAPLLTEAERKQAAKEASMRMHPATGRYSPEDPEHEGRAT